MPAVCFMTSAPLWERQHKRAERLMDCCGRIERRVGLRHPVCSDEDLRSTTWMLFFYFLSIVPLPVATRVTSTSCLFPMDPHRACTEQSGNAWLMTVCLPSIVSTVTYFVSHTFPSPKSPWGQPPCKNHRCC
jgi:hypothetical protein